MRPRKLKISKAILERVWDKLPEKKKKEILKAIWKMRIQAKLSKSKGFKVFTTLALPITFPFTLLLTLLIAVQLKRKLRILTNKQIGIIKALQKEIKLLKREPLNLISPERKGKK